MSKKIVIVHHSGYGHTAKVAAAVAAALEGKAALELLDSRGRRVIVPVAGIGYVEIGAETRTRVGFGSL